MCFSRHERIVALYPSVWQSQIYFHVCVGVRVGSGGVLLALSLRVWLLRVYDVSGEQPSLRHALAISIFARVIDLFVGFRERPTRPPVSIKPGVAADRTTLFAICFACPATYQSSLPFSSRSRPANGRAVVEQAFANHD